MTALDPTLSDALTGLLTSSSADLRPAVKQFPEPALQHAWGVAWAVVSERSYPLAPSLAAGLLAALADGFAGGIRPAAEIAERYALIGQVARLAQAAIAAADGRAGPDIVARYLDRLEGLGVPQGRYEHPEAALCGAVVAGRYPAALTVPLSQRVTAGAVLAWVLGLRDDVPTELMDAAEDPLTDLPRNAAELATLASDRALRPLAEVQAERERWEGPLRAGTLASGGTAWSHAVEVVRALRWVSEPWWPELALTPWQADAIIVREHAASRVTSVEGLDPDGRAVRRAWGAVVIALAATDRADEAAALAAVWPSLADRDADSWDVVVSLLPDPLRAPVEGMVAGFTAAPDVLADATLAVVACAATLRSGDAEDAVSAERHLRSLDVAPEALHLGQQEAREEGLALAIRVGARLALEVIEVLGQLHSPEEVDTVAWLRRLPSDLDAWLTGTTAVAAAVLEVPASDDLRAVLLEATTALVLLNQGLLATDEPDAVRWLCAEAGAAWTRVRAAVDALREGTPASLVPDPDAERLLRDDRAECWSLAHLERSEARWDAFVVELKDLLGRLERREVTDPKAAWAHVARWAALDGLVPELQGVPLAVGQQLATVARSLSS